MGTMHKEVIERRKASTIVVSIIVLCLMIVLSNYNKSVVIYNEQVSIFINIFIIVLTIAFGVFQVVRCRTYYKYSIVADKLIIHKVKSTGQVTLENIKIKDIVYLGKIISSPKKYPISSTRFYVCNIIGLKTYCCIYKDTHKYKKFYFPPSEELLTNLTLNRLLSHNLKEQGIIDIKPPRNIRSGLSLGVVSQKAPCIQSYISIIEDESIKYGTKEFRDSTLTDHALEVAVKTALALASTGYDIIESEELLGEVKGEFHSFKKDLK